MSEVFIKTVQRVRIAGNYIEFWFEEDQKLKKEIIPANDSERFALSEGFDACIKYADFVQKFHETNIFNEVFNNGFVGQKILWKWSQYKTHYEFVDFADKTRTTLIEKIQ